MPQTSRIDIAGKKLHLRSPTLWQLISILRNAISYDAFRQDMEPYMEGRALDVGASVGAWGIMIALAFPKTRVVCIEPSIYSWEYLTHNTKKFSNIKCIKVAISDNRGTLTIGMPPDVSVLGNTGWITAHGYGQEMKETVHTIPLDELREGVTFIKIDVEGHELHVLNGMEKLLSEIRPAIVMELRDRHLERAGTSAKELIQKMASYRYGHYQYFGDVLFLPA